MGLIDREQLTCIGIIAQPHGVQGEMKVTPMTDTPDFYRGVTDLILETARGLQTFKVEKIRSVTNGWIISLQGVDGRNQAQELAGASVMLENDQLRPLDNGEYFRHDLIGCVVETTEGRALGKVEEVMETGANDVLVVSGGEEEVMIPLVGEVVKAVDLEEKVIRIAPLPGLLDGDGKQ